MKITQVNFRSPVSFGGAGTTDFYDSTKQREFGSVTIVEKGNFLIITGIHGFPAHKRKRVPLSNVLEITEIDEEVEAKLKADAERAKEPPAAPAQPAGQPLPLTAARGLNKTTEAS